MITTDRTTNQIWSITGKASSTKLKYSFDMAEEADCIENAVSKVLDAGYRTADIMPDNKEKADKCTKIGCSKMGDLIVENLKKGN